jgi:phosphinothricin acetyltransferase
LQSAEIRLADVDDACRILEIYAPYVSDTSLTLTSKIPTLEQIVQKMDDIKKYYPYLICCVKGELVGFAYAHRLQPHAAFNWNVDLAIFIDPKFQGRGIATALYTALFQILKLQGFCNLYATITMPNDASMALHHHFGFKELVVMEKFGYKHGSWHDTLIMGMKIPGFSDSDSLGKPLQMSQLNSNHLTTILAMASALLNGANQKGES